MAADRDPRRAAISDPVADFYDRHPYPPPVDELDQERAEWRDVDRRRADYHLLWPAAAFREDEAILVAGCGTAEAARYAIRHPAARVVGIDVSAASLEHTRSLKRRYRLTNLTLHQLPIERVGELDDRFDRIACTGVLHRIRHQTPPSPPADEALGALLDEAYGDGPGEGRLTPPRPPELVLPALADHPDGAGA
jgi:SAM-dependent methyltransferase